MSNETLFTIISAVLIIGSVILLSRSKKQWNIQTLVFGALCIAMSFILSYLSINVGWTEGGSISLNMIPIIIFAMIFGPFAGFAAGITLGALLLLKEMLIVNPIQPFFDYIFAYGVLFIVALFPPRKYIWGVAAAGFVKFLFHFMAGILFYSMYAPPDQPVWLYSLIYNGTYVFPETFLCIIILLVPQVNDMIQRLHGQFTFLRKKPA